MRAKRANIRHCLSVHLEKTGHRVGKNGYFWTIFRYEVEPDEALSLLWYNRTVSGNGAGMSR